jgi:hypothetical protein
LGGSIPRNIVNRPPPAGRAVSRSSKAPPPAMCTTPSSRDHPRPWHPPTKAPSGCTNFDEAAPQTRGGDRGLVIDLTFRRCKKRRCTFNPNHPRDHPKG